MGRVGAGAEAVWAGHVGAHAAAARPPAPAAATAAAARPVRVAHVRNKVCKIEVALGGSGSWVETGGIRREQVLSIGTSSQLLSQSCTLTYTPSNLKASPCTELTSLPSSGACSLRL